MKDQPAFPIPGETWNYGDGTFTDAPHLGMTMRDYFAVRAMQSMMGTLWMAAVNKKLPIKDSLKDITSLSYAIADAMLAARGK